MKSTTCRAAVFEKVGRPLDVRDFDVPGELEPGSALCRVRLATICGSDLHTITGRRKEPTPLVLGHEIVGEIEALGAGLERDGFGQPLKVGDRISWTIMAFCGRCYFCSHGLPQKCESLKKYGHTACNDPSVRSGLVGGYADCVYILPGTAVFKVPESLSDAVAAPANCALSTVVNAVETIGVEKDDVVLIQGSGLLGLNAAALAREAGAREVVVTDVLDPRLEQARRFGATRVFNLRNQPWDRLKAEILEITSGRGADVAIEVCGARDAVRQAVDVLRIGARYLIAGLVTPGSTLDVDGNLITRKCLTIRGIHNYRPEHLGQALRFLERNHRKYPYADLVKVTYPLAEINEAVKAADTGAHIRVGVRP